VISLFFMQLILAFVVVTYQRVSHELTDRCGLTPLGYKCLVHVVHAKVPTDPLSAHRNTKSFQMLTSKRFEVFLFVVIVLNTIGLLMHHNRESEGWSEGLFWANVVFVVVFSVEAFAKVATFGLTGYVGSPLFCVQLLG
jgi:hypothetical protein